MPRAATAVGLVLAAAASQAAPTSPAGAAGGPVPAAASPALAEDGPVAAAASPALPDDGPPPGWFGPPPGWSGGVLAGAARVRDYEGSRGAHLEPVLGGLATWRGRLGVVEAGSRGLVWQPVFAEDHALGVGLAVDPGRVDTGARKLTPMGDRPGSDRLRGMGEIRMTPLLTLSGSIAVAGVPLAATLRQATGSYGGARLELGASVPWHPARHLSLTIAPSVTVADRRTMRAYFGVTPAQSAASGRAAFDAHAGAESAQLAVEADLRLSRHWHVRADVVARRLLRDAAASPVTESRRQAGAMLAALYTFP